MGDRQTPPRSIKDYTVDKEGMQALREALNTDDDPRIRQMASFFLGSTRDSRAVEPLIAALHDPEKDVRAHAVMALVKLGSVAVRPLTAALCDEDWRVQYRACEALGLIDDAVSFDPLVSALRDEKDHVRYMAAKGLGQMGDPRAFDPLIAARTDENEYVRRSIATALGSLGSEKALHALQKALLEESSESVRRTISKILKDAGTQPS